MPFRMPYDPDAFSKDPSNRKRQGGRRHERDHLAFVRRLPCCICGSRRNVEAAHLRMAAPLMGKSRTGMGTKPDDCYVTPLCAEHHRTGEDAQHKGSEAEFWDRHGVNPFDVAAALYMAHGNGETAELAIRATVQKARKAVSA